MSGVADEFDRRYKRLAGTLVVLALIPTIAYGGFAGRPGHVLQAMMAALLSAAAPFALGGLLGFLFGIPKTLQSASTSAQATDNRGSSKGARHAWETNTNLEQVSDWLTKILLGIGLTQLTQVPEKIQTAGDYIAGCIGPDASGAFGSTVLIVFAIAGFVTAYLLTKFDLGRAIDRQDGVMDALTTAVNRAPNDRRTVEGMVFASLYLPEPEGFQSAIQAATAYLSRAEIVSETDDGTLDAYLACAYAQQYLYQRDVERKSATELATTRSKAFDSVRAAVGKSKEWKGWFRQLMNPPVGSVENDFVVFRGDPQLGALLA